MSLVCEPKVLIADEPTTALDVTIQAQILSLLDRLKEELGMAVLLITHDMGVVAGRADRINVMYAGKMIEATDTRDLFAHMHHPYTQSLLASIPQLDQDADAVLFSIPGLPPDLSDPPDGCRFAPRCHLATRPCRTEEPPLTGDDPIAHVRLLASGRRSGRAADRRARARCERAVADAAGDQPLLADPGAGPGVPGRQLAAAGEIPRLGQGGVRRVGRRCRPARRSGWSASRAVARRRSGG